MLIKQHIYVTNPMEFAEGNLMRCFGMFGHKPDIDGWVYAGEVELDIDVDRQECINVSLKAIRRQRLELAAKLELLDQAEQSILCIEHGGE